MSENIIRVGSRKSELALIQTNYVISCLKKLNPDVHYELVTMSTLGDRILNVSLPKIGEKSLFTKDLEEALVLGSVDFVVHSLKDLPTCLPPGLGIGAILERDDPRDALVLREDYAGHTLASLPQGSIIGTSSLRRTAQLARSHPHLKVVDIRGNLNTRLKKLDHHCTVKNPATSAGGDECEVRRRERLLLHPEYSGLVLAQAGLVRMGWHDRVSQVLPCGEMLYAVGQGALAVECLAGNARVLAMLAPLSHPDTYCRILTERSFLKTLGGGCSAPVAVSTTFKPFTGSDVKGYKMKVTGAVWSLDGKVKLEETLEQSLENYQKSPKGQPIKGKHKIEFDESDLNDLKPKCLRSSIEETNGNGSLKESYNASDDCVIQSTKKNTECSSKCAQANGSSCSGSYSSSKDEVDNSSKIMCCRQSKKFTKKSEPIDIENLINIHGKLFITCPFSKMDQGLCPMPVGQDFMGQCPYFDTSNISAIEDEINKKITDIHGDKTANDIRKCPFMSNQVVALNAKNIGETPGPSSEADVKIVCPLKMDGFCANSKLSDVKTQECNVDLYCGLTKHFDLTTDVVKICENLGIELARNLIAQGALDVMRVSQDFIREGISSTVKL